VSSYLEIQLAQQPIELCKLLKAANLVGGGGEAKVVISEGYVLLNGEVEFQKRKKIYHNDIVEFNGEVLQVTVIENSEDFDEKSEQHDTSNNVPTEHEEIPQPCNNQVALDVKTEPESQVKTPRRRKPISF